MLRPDMPIPSDWKRTCIKILYKKGVPQLPENYRPISILPILYKLFRQVLLARIQESLDAAQSCDQAGFRSGFSCDDHLFATCMLFEKCREFRLPLWTAAVDFKKAFDTVEHNALWESLALQGVPESYNCMLQRLYASQQAYIATDRTSKEFNLTRGTKQGDPVSPMLFNAVLEHVFRPLKHTWQSQGLAVQVGTADMLTNLRFADDVLLVATSELRFGKTEILCNKFCRDNRQSETAASISIGGNIVEILPVTGDTMYLGRLLSFSDFHAKELRHRINKGWKKFAVHKKTLCDKSALLSHRLKLFAATVTPTVLHGSCTWTLTADMERELQTVQRKMLRQIVGPPRHYVADEASSDSPNVSLHESSDREGVLEDWVTWIQRVTHKAQNELGKLGIKEWVFQFREQKWNRAHSVANMPNDRWAKILLTWEPSAGTRRVGRPEVRWDDSIADLFDTSALPSRQEWLLYAVDDETWEAAGVRYRQASQSM